MLVDKNSFLTDNKSMKQVLIIDASPTLKEYLKFKFTEENIHCEFSSGVRDSFSTMLEVLPELIILNAEKLNSSVMEFLSKKSSNPNGKKIPIIMTGPVISKDDVEDLVQYGVIKYFTQPIKFETFFVAVGKILRSAFMIDQTPCVLDIHLNKTIIFIEIAMGMNREKLALLRYKITEIIDANKLAMPKIVVMMTDLNLSFVDGFNLELLFDNIIADQRVLKKNVKVLSLDSIVKELIEGHTEYSGIEVVTNLSEVLNSLMNDEEAADTSDDNVHEMISENILASDGEMSTGELEMRFSPETETQEENFETQPEVTKKYTIAIVDDDPAIRFTLNNAFMSIGFETNLYQNGSEFLTALLQKRFDIAILDIIMPGMSGFDVLKTLVQKRVNLPIIMYSDLMQKEAIVQALTMGAKSYLLKPQSSDVIIQKVFEILKGK